MTSPTSNLIDHGIPAAPAQRSLLEVTSQDTNFIQASEIPHHILQGASPLSFAQERLWFLDQLEPGKAVYNTCEAHHLRGGLNITAVEQSLNEIIRRHGALRTTFAIKGGHPVQIISPTLRLPLSVIDLTDRPVHEREVEAQRLLHAEACQPFNLSRGPLLRVRLIKLAEEEHILVFTLPHIVTDEWSMSVLSRELSTLYQAFSTNQPSPLPDLTFQYTDYAIQQRQQLQGEVLNRQLSYWKQQLKDSPAVIDLPTDYPRPIAQSFHGAQQTIVLPQSLVDELKKVSRQGGGTLNMTLMAALQALLHRYTGQNTIVVGSPVAGRRGGEIKKLIGFFVNTLAIKIDLSGNPTFTELLTRVRQTTFAAYYHRDVPFEKVVEEVQPIRTLSYSPLFQVMLAFQNAQPSTLMFPGVTATSQSIFSDTARFDLVLTPVEQAGMLKLTMQYNTDLFAQRTISQLLEHYRMLLQGIAKNPNLRLSEIPLLSSTEKHQLLVDWNATTRDYPHDQCVHQLFEAQAQRTPDATAVVYEQTQLTYRELNARANQLAHHLRHLGVGPDTLVALCMDRSLELVVGLLGILKAGGAYVPLDPGYPPERLQFMLADTQAAVLLTQQHLVDALPPQQAPVLCLDRDWPRISQEPDTTLAPPTTADHLAYVIYTSGSTGQPKGVAVPHRGILRLVCGTDYVPFSAQAVFLQLAPISFDAATFELWGALLHGATCVLFPGRIASPEELGRILRKHGVSILWLTASLFNHLIDQAPEILTGVKQLITGGEALSVAHARRALTLLPQTQLINGYGPTESTTFACTYALPQHLAETTSSIPIGRPIANTTAYILDVHHQPVPIGVTGELYLGGDGLARGYLNRPELTVEQFIFDPFSGQSGARLYKTGDLARYLPDGNIEFLGRRDNQVKIRGFRIELGEIETVLGQHPQVGSCVVMAQEQQPGEKRLVAYVVPAAGQKITYSDLLSFLRTRVPDYMLPVAFVFLDSLPLTPNGKIDHKALPRPESTRPELAQGYVAPRTPEEELIAAVWREVLGLTQVGIHDNFFELGGHSLKATQVVARLRTALRIEFPLRILFEAPTTTGLAASIAQYQLRNSAQVELELSQLLAEIEDLSDNEAEQMLCQLQNTNS